MPFVGPTFPYSVVDCFVIFWHAGLLLLEWVDYSFGVWPALIFQTFLIAHALTGAGCDTWRLLSFDKHAISKCHVTHFLAFSISDVTPENRRIGRDFGKIVLTNFALYLVELTVQLISSITLKTLSAKTFLSSSVGVMMISALRDAKLVCLKGEICWSTF